MSSSIWDDEHAAIAHASLAADDSEILMARLYGEKIVERDGPCVLTMHRHNGKLFITDYYEEKPK